MLRYSLLVLLVGIGVCLGAVIPVPSLQDALQPINEQPNQVLARQERAAQFGGHGHGHHHHGGYGGGYGGYGGGYGGYGGGGYGYPGGYGGYGHHHHQHSPYYGGYPNYGYGGYPGYGYGGYPGFGVYLGL